MRVFIIEKAVTTVSRLLRITLYFKTLETRDTRLEHGGSYPRYVDAVGLYFV